MNRYRHRESFSDSRKLGGSFRSRAASFAWRLTGAPRGRGSFRSRAVSFAWRLTGALRGRATRRDARSGLRPSAVGFARAPHRRFAAGAPRGRATRRDARSGLRPSAVGFARAPHRRFAAGALRGRATRRDARSGLRPSAGNRPNVFVPARRSAGVCQRTGKTGGRKVAHLLVSCDLAAARPACFRQSRSRSAGDT